MLRRLTSLLFPLILLGRMPDFASGACGSNTCLNNGTCDPNYKGTGFRCICSKEGKVDYGPRCELLIRGYLSTFPQDTSKKYAMTKHDLSGHTIYADRLSISFEFVAHCHRPPCKFFVIRDASSNPLLTIEMLAIDENIPGDQVYLRSWIPRMDHSDIQHAMKTSMLKSEIDAWSPHWQSLTLGLFKAGPQVISAKLILCSLKAKKCKDVVMQSEIIRTDMQSVFKSSTLSIGRFVGCIRNVRVNGALVDLGNVAGYEGSTSRDDEAFTLPFCPFFMFSCQKFDRKTREFQQNYCGKDSQCNGEVKRFFSGYGESCTCRCINGKRRLKETVSDSEKCTNYTLLDNECNIDSPTLSLGSVNFRVEWKMQNGANITNGKNHMSLEANFRTREMNCAKVFELVSGNVPVSYISISNGLLHACDDRNDCNQFSNALVSDDEWHFFSLTLTGQKICTTLDEFTQCRFSPDSFQYDGASLVLSLPNSCVRAVRLSNIYMPTGGSDRTADDENSFITVVKGSGVVVNAAECQNLKSVNEIPSNGSIYEISGNGINVTKCRLNSGVQTCECIDGYERDTRGNCIVGIELIPGVLPASCDSVRPGLLVIAFTAACHLVHIRWDFIFQP